MGVEWLILTFKCLGLKTIAITTISILLLIIALTLISGFVMGLYTFYDELTIPERIKDRAVIVMGFALAPFTSLIRISSVKSLTSNVSSLLSDVGYEVITIALVGNESVIVRGVSKDFLRKYVNYTVVKGVDVNDLCYACAWIGESLANDLNVNVGDTITLYSLFTQVPITLKVKGILRIEKPYDYEVLVPYRLGQLIRGTSGDTASIAILILKNGVSPNEVLSKLSLLSSRMPYLLERVFIALKHLGKEVKPSMYRYASEVLTERLGIPRNTLIAITLAIVFITSIGSYIVGLVPFILNKEELILIHEQGVAWSKIRFTIVLLGITAIIATYLITKFLLGSLHHVINVSILHHKLSLAADISLDVAIPSFTALFYTLGSITGDVIED